MIFCANPWTGFYIIETFVTKDLNSTFNLIINLSNTDRPEDTKRKDKKEKRKIKNV